MKPLYYAEVGDLLVFGSELKAVLASCLVSEELDWAGASTPICGSASSRPREHRVPPSADTLLPGCRLVIERGRVVEERWWSVSHSRTHAPSGLTLRENAAALLELLEDSVRLSSSATSRSG